MFDIYSNSRPKIFYNIKFQYFILYKNRHWYRSDKKCVAQSFFFVFVGLALYLVNHFLCSSIFSIHDNFLLLLCFRSHYIYLLLLTVLMLYQSAKLAKFFFLFQSAYVLHLKQYNCCHFYINWWILWTSCILLLLFSMCKIILSSWFFHFSCLVSYIRCFFWISILFAFFVFHPIPISKNFHSAMKWREKIKNSSRKKKKKTKSYNMFEHVH